MVRDQVEGQDVDVERQQVPNNAVQLSQSTQDECDWQMQKEGSQGREDF